MEKQHEISGNETNNSNDNDSNYLLIIIMSYGCIVTLYDWQFVTDHTAPGCKITD